MLAAPLAPLLSQGLLSSSSRWLPVIVHKCAESVENFATWIKQHYGLKKQCSFYASVM